MLHTKDTGKVNKHMKRYSISLVIRHMQTKTTAEILKILARMAKKKKLTIPKFGEDMEQIQLSYIVGGSVK